MCLWQISDLQQLSNVQGEEDNGGSDQGEEHEEVGELGADDDGNDGRPWVHLWSFCVRPKEFRMQVFEERHGYKALQEKREAKAAKVENISVP